MAEIRREKILIEKKLYDAQLQYFAKNDQKNLKDLYSYWKQLKSGMHAIYDGAITTNNTGLSKLLHARQQ